MLVAFYFRDGMMYYSIDAPNGKIMLTSYNIYNVVLPSVWGRREDLKLPNNILQGI